jgi:NAD(P)-dependent dehydrogenase (short-subunit alcohol dehydrogenase family)
MPRYDLDGQVAIVTGAGRGIGRAVALDLARAGARVVVNDYGVAVDGSQPSEGPAQDTVNDIKNAGGEAVAVFESVTTMEGGERIIKTALDTYGKLDILVCVAGILRERMIFNMPEDDWDAVIATHLKGHFTTMKPATIIMRQQRSGRIITFTSSAGLDGSPGQPNYSAAKEGIVGLTRSTALAMAKYGVTCNSIAPGAQTRMTERTIGTPSERRRADSGPALAEHIAPVVTFLASDQAGHITGQVVGVRGNKVSLYSQPRQIRSAFRAEGWTAEEIAAIWDDALGVDQLDRFSAMGLPTPDQAVRPAVTAGD